MDLIYNEWKSVAAERFIRTLKTKICKTWLKWLDDIVNECNNAYHRTTKMKPVNIKIKHILTLIKKFIIKILHLKLVIM